jgi:hypothetical protein
MKKPIYQITTQKITPDIAIGLLKKNKINRILRTRKVNDYAKVMKEGGWKCIPDCICISTDGYLINGQHRLHALIKANVTLYFSVAVNVEPELYMHVDNVLPRSGADTLKSAGLNGLASKIAQAARNVIYEEENGNTLRFWIPNYKIAEQVRKNPSLLRAVEDVHGVAKKGTKQMFSDAVASAYYFMLGSESWEFFEKLYTGENLPNDSPVIHLRNVLIDNMNNPLRKLSRFNKINLMKKAWNYYITGKPVGRSLSIKKNEKISILQPEEV